MLVSLQASDMARQIGLRLEENQLARLDAYCTQKGMDRTSVVRLAINQLIDGSQPAPVASSTAVVDQPARDALVALRNRVEAIEDQLPQIVAEARHVAMMERTQAIETAKAANDDFASSFGRV